MQRYRQREIQKPEDATSSRSPCQGIYDSDFQDSQGIDNIDANKFFNLSAERHSYSTRQPTVVTDDTYVPTPTLGLLKGSSKLALRSNFFSQRVVQPWNLLPPVIKQTDSVISFKAMTNIFVNMNLKVTIQSEHISLLCTLLYPCDYLIILYYIISNSKIGLYKIFFIYKLCKTMQKINKVLLINEA